MAIVLARYFTCAALATAALTLGCSSGPARLSEAQAQQRLQRIVLTGPDIGVGYGQDVARFISDEDAANARPDSDVARRQYADWGQVLAYNVQYAAPQASAAVFSGETTRVMNTATIFNSANGANDAFAYVRSLPDSVVANFLVNDAAGTRISDVQATKDIEFAAKGDDSFAWRLSGKATFASGDIVTFVADSVFLRAGRVMGNVTSVALGSTPDRRQLEQLVDTFVAHATSVDT
jgi:hypothetical protein